MKSDVAALEVSLDEERIEDNDGEGGGVSQEGKVRAGEQGEGVASADGGEQGGKKKKNRQHVRKKQRPLGGKDSDLRVMAKSVSEIILFCG